MIARRLIAMKSHHLRLDSTRRTGKTRCAHLRLTKTPLVRNSCGSGRARRERGMSHRLSDLRSRSSQTVAARPETSAWAVIRIKFDGCDAPSRIADAALLASRCHCWPPSGRTAGPRPGGGCCRHATRDRRPNTTGKLSGFWRDLPCVARFRCPPCDFGLTPEGGDVGFRCDDSVAPPLLTPFGCQGGSSPNP